MTAKVNPSIGVKLNERRPAFVGKPEVGTITLTYVAEYSDMVSLCEAMEAKQIPSAQRLRHLLSNLPTGFISTLVGRR